jgi:hypothetical protein
MGFPVFHILEPKIKAQIDPSAFKEHLEIMDIALEVERISQALNKVRGKNN